MSGSADLQGANSGPLFSQELTHFGFDDPKSVICKMCFGKLESLVHTRIKAQELKQFLLDKIEAFGERLGLQKKACRCECTFYSFNFKVSLAI